MSGDGKLLASADQDGRVVVWDLAARKPKATLKGPRHLRQLAFTPDDSALACPGMGVEFLDVAKATGNAFAAEDRARAEQWAAFEKVSKRFARPTLYAPVVAFTADAGRFAVAESERQVRVWDTASLDRPLATFDSPVPTIRAVAFSPDGKRLAVGGGDYNHTRGEAQVWDLAAGKVVVSIKAHTRPVAALAFSPDGAVVASGADHWDHTVRVTELVTGKAVATYDAPELSVAALAHDPKDKVLVATGFMHRDAFFSWDYGKAGKADVLGPRGDYRDRLAFAADGKTLVRFQDNRVEVWDWPARKLRLDRGHDRGASRVLRPVRRRDAGGHWRAAEPGPGLDHSGVRPGDRQVPGRPPGPPLRPVRAGLYPGRAPVGRGHGRGTGCGS